MPCLFASRSAEIDLTLQILAIDPFSSPARSALHWFDEDAAGLFAHVNCLIYIQVRGLQVSNGSFIRLPPQQDI